MKKITKRIMAGIFALAMVLTMLPQVTAKAAVENEATVDMTELQVYQDLGQEPYVIYANNEEAGFFENQTTLLSGRELFVLVMLKDTSDIQHNLDIDHLQITSSNSNVINVKDGKRYTTSYVEDAPNAQQAAGFRVQVGGNVGDTTTLTVSYNGTLLYQQSLTVSEQLPEIPRCKLKYNGTGLTLDTDRFYSHEEIFNMLKEDLVFYDKDKQQQPLLLDPGTTAPEKSGYYVNFYMKDRGSIGRYVINGITYDWDYKDMSDGTTAWDQFVADHNLDTRDENSYSYTDGILNSKAGSGELHVYVWYYDKIAEEWDDLYNDDAEIDVPITFVKKQTNTITATGDSNVTISGSDEYLPDGAKFDIAVIKNGNVFDTVKNLIKKAIASVKNWAVYEMNLKDVNGAEIHQLNGYVQVVMPIPTGLSVSDKQTLCVYRVDGDKMIACETTVKDGKVYFNTNHFSTYVVAEVPITAADTTQPTTSPKTGENMLLFLGLGAAAITLLAASLMVAKKRYLR